MSQVATVENITVLQVGKYGVRVDDKTWYGVNEPLTPSHFAPGTTYNVSLSTSKTGKKYIKEVLNASEGKGAAPQAQAAVVDAVDHDRAQRIIASAGIEQGKALKDTLQDKDIRIQRQGSFQAALHSPALTSWAVNVDEYLALCRRAADVCVAYINE